MKTDSLTQGWKDEQAKIYFTTQNSKVKQYPDTSIEQFHRYQHQQPWWGNTLGNYGTAATNLFFTPNQEIGFRLGYDVYDLYAFSPDRVRLYNTTRPYSSFSFLLGSKAQQNVDFLHTQNISPNWNFAGRIRYLSSEGFFAQQKAGSISGSFATDYKSENERYQATAILVYNKFNQDENGGILSDSFLSLPNYSDRRRIPVHIPANGNNRSALTNSLRNIHFSLQNNYSWGKADTLYNEDSTKATYRFTPRFRLQHELIIQSEQHVLKDLNPDSLRYNFIAPLRFAYNDSVFGEQSWRAIENKFSLNGFLGKDSNLAQMKVGIANKIDLFEDYSIHDRNKTQYVSNFLFGRIQKEAITEQQWAYTADASFYFSGKAVGDFLLNISAGKGLGKYGDFSAGIRQSLSEAPYTYEHFKTNLYSRENSFGKTSITRLWGRIAIPEIKFQILLSNLLLNNYLYFNEDVLPVQYSSAFNVTQLSVRKQFNYRIFALDNEVVWQQATANAPVHLPSFLIREQIKIETYLFQNALKVATGLEGRYNANYYIPGYSPYYNQFYLQDSFKASNLPEISAFFNFKVKSFRAFVLVDQLQSFFWRNNINAMGYYPQGDFAFRFGFTWVLVN